MKSRSVFVVISFLVVALIYSSSSTTLQVLAEPSGPVSCKQTGTLIITCCQDHIINRSPSNPAGTLVTYCTDCEVGSGGDFNRAGACSERYIPMGAEQPSTPIPPGALARLQEGDVLGEATRFPEVSVNEAQRANVTILPGGSIQSEEASNDAENDTATQDNEEMGTDDQNGESESTQKQFSERAEESNDDEASINEELPLE